MYRLLTAVFLACFALGLAAPAYAEKGDKWRDRGGENSQRDNDDRRGDGKRNGGWGKERRNDGDRKYQNRRGNDDDRKWRNRDDDDDRGYDNRRRNDDKPWFGRRREHDRARDGVMRGRMMPLEELENRISRRTPGYRIGNPEFMMIGGRPIYRIRWRTPDGHILIIFADAETGQIIDIRGR